MQGFNPHRLIFAMILAFFHDKLRIVVLACGPKKNQEKFFLQHRDQIMHQRYSNHMKHILTS